MNKDRYYGCANPESVSYLEFGSLNLVKGEKSIWGYWQDQAAYDLYMFARYSRDLFEFRKFFNEEDKSVETLNSYVLRSAHNKLTDYIFKYAGMLTVREESIICECGSSLWGWIDEAIACDQVFFGGKNISKIRGFQYVGSDISELMNDGARAFHSDANMDFTTAGTISEMVSNIRERLTNSPALFYGLSVNVRYAVRDAMDLVNIADIATLSIYNRLSLTYDDQTAVLVYGTGKNVYVISLPALIEGLRAKGICAKYCTANMQHERDGKNTVRASIAISRDSDTLSRFVDHYSLCIEKSKKIPGVVSGEWHELDHLFSRKKSFE